MNHYFMRILPQIYFADTKEKLLEEIDIVHKEIILFYREVPDELYSAIAIPDGWTVERNIKHIISSNRIFAKWLALPRFFLKLWIKPNPVQPKLEEILTTNRPKFFDYGKYIYKKSKKIKDKESLLTKVQESADKLKSCLEKKTEEDLDSLPGPIGGINLRSFIHFILKHNLHHTNVVRTRWNNSI